MEIPQLPRSSPLSLILTPSHTELTYNPSAQTTVENPVSNSISIVECVTVAAGRCLPSRCLETALHATILITINDSALSYPSNRRHDESRKHFGYGGKCYYIPANKSNCRSMNLWRREVGSKLCSVLFVHHMRLHSNLCSSPQQCQRTG
jgi:hypothetical protein